MTTTTLITSTPPITLHEQVASLLAWSEEQLAEFKYKQGIAYLMWYLPCNDRSRATLERSKLYWNWWKQHWAYRDEAFIESAISVVSIHHRRAIYKELHNARILINDNLKPGEVVTRILFQQPKIKQVA